MLECPVLHAEKLVLEKSPVLHSLGGEGRLHADGVPGDVPGGDRFFQIGPRTDDAQPRDHDHPRPGIEGLDSRRKVG